MKIFEVISLQEANWEQMKGTDFIPAGLLKGNAKIPVTQVKVVGTDAENLKIDGMPIKGRLFVMGEWMNWKAMKQASHFYLKMPSGGLQRIDDKNFSTSVVNAMNMANQPSGRIDRIKDKAADFFDPNSADRDGYNALQRKNAAQDKASVAVTRAGAKLDKWSGLDGTGRGVGGMAKGVWNKLTGRGPKKPVSPDYTSQPGHKEQPGPKSGGRQKGGKSQTDSAKRQRELRRIKQLQSGDIVTYTYGDNKTGEGELRGYNPRNKKEFVLKMVDPFNPNAPKDPMGNPLVSVPTNQVFKKQGSNFDPVKGWQKRGDRENQTPRNPK